MGVTYNDFYAAVETFRQAKTPSQYKIALDQLATALESLNPDLDQLDTVMHNKITNVVDKLKNEVTVVIGGVNKYMIGGVNIWQTVDDTFACWHPEKGTVQDDIKCFVANIKKLIKEIEGLRSNNAQRWFDDIRL